MPVYLFIPEGNKRLPFSEGEEARTYLGVINHGVMEVEVA